MTLEHPQNAVPPRCHHDGDTAHALFAAVAQIALALRESQDSVAELGTLFARQAEALTAARAGEVAQAATGHGNAGAAATVSRPPLEQLRADVFNGIQQLQFYDRLVQHLAHIQDYLIAVANELDAFKPQPQSHDFWDTLHAKFRKRLISDEQRGMLDLFLMPDTATRVSAQAAPSDYSPPGSLEIF